MKWSELAARSYVPYSKKQICCVVKSKSGHFFPGVRIENIAFPDTITAAQAAIFSCLSEGEAPDLIYVTDEEPEGLERWVDLFSLRVMRSEQSIPLPFHQVIRPEPDAVSAYLNRLLDRAVVPNSDFPVSAILQTPEGIIDGVNIEVADWTLGLCAERVAIAKAISYGEQNFERMYVHTRYGGFSSPCGSCRQVLAEHMPNAEIELHHADHSQSVHQILDLLPFHFSTNTLIK